MYPSKYIELIRTAKYATALAHSDDLQLDSNMSFLRGYVEANSDFSPKKYIVSKSNSRNDRELL